MKLIFNARVKKINLAMSINLKDSEDWERAGLASSAVDFLTNDEYLTCIKNAKAGKEFSSGEIQLILRNGSLYCVRRILMPAEFIDVSSVDDAQAILRSRGIRANKCKPKRWVFFPAGDSDNLRRYVDHVGTAYDIPVRAMPLTVAFMRLDGCDIEAGLIAD